MSETKFRAGDVVKHRRTGETWCLANDEDSGHVMPMGWPECTAQASDCELVTAATDDERADVLRRSAESRGGHRADGYSYRASLALQQLHESKLCGGNCRICQHELLRRFEAKRDAVLEAAIFENAAHAQSADLARYECGTPELDEMVYCAVYSFHLFAMQNRRDAVDAFFVVLKEIEEKAIAERLDLEERKRLELDAKEAAKLVAELPPRDAISPAAPVQP